MKYRQGTQIKFRDHRGLTTDKDDAIAVGVVNGKPFEESGVLYIPVWCKREGREPTTIMVAETNVVDADQ